MRQGMARCVAAGVAAMSVAALAGCESAGVQRNFDRGSLQTDIRSEANLFETAVVSDLSGTASYAGVAAAEFSTQQGSFAATADMRMTADFSNSTLNGVMTGWTHEDPLNYDMRGRVRISNGVINPQRLAALPEFAEYAGFPEGSFVAQTAGNVEAVPTARNLTANRAEDAEPVRQEWAWFGGTATGSFHDTAGTGQRATHVVGEFATGGDEASPVRAGGFFALRRD